MPEISRFLGIVVRMLYDDHSPPHFHAVYGKYKITIEVETGIIAGSFPRRALNLVMEWYLIHKQELEIDWQLAKKHEKLNSIAPLE